MAVVWPLFSVALARKLGLASTHRSMPTKSQKPSHAKKFAAIEQVSILGVVGRMGPIGLWMYASSYVKAACALPAPSAGFEPVRYHLVCHGTELGLKALLSIHGATMLELAESAYGHNLQKILEAAKSRGLNNYVSLFLQHEQEITKAAKYYAGKLFEYPAVGEALQGYPELPDINVLLEAANLIVNGLETPCKEAP